MITVGVLRVEAVVELRRVVENAVVHRIFA